MDSSGQTLAGLPGHGGQCPREGPVGPGTHTTVPQGRAAPGAALAPANGMLLLAQGFGAHLRMTPWCPVPTVALCQGYRGGWAWQLKVRTPGIRWGRVHTCPVSPGCWALRGERLTRRSPVSRGPSDCGDRVDPVGPRARASLWGGLFLRKENIKIKIAH